MEALAASLGISIGMLVLAAIAAAALFPVFWVWMLVDAILRDTTAYPSRDSNEKLVWILLLVFIQAAAIVYFAMVWAKMRQASAPAGPTPVATA
jgi:hypothetical protein